MNINSDEILKVLNGVFDTLSKQFGVAVDKLYPVLLRQIQYCFVMDIFWIVVSLLVITGAILLALKLTKNTLKNKLKYIESRKNCYTCDTDSYDVKIAGVWIAFGLISLICALIIFSCTSEMIQINMNPDWFIYSTYIKPLITK